MIFKTTVRSKYFLAELKRRADAFRGQNFVGAIIVPDSLQWWYWLEFGTALRGETGRASGHTYEIDPIAALMLSWPGEQGRVFRAHVVHPGIKPRAFVRKVLPDIREQARKDIVESLAYHGFIPEAAQFALEKTMQSAVEKIADSLALEAPGTRVDGKLGGASAADTFRENAQVVAAPTVTAAL